MVYKHCKTNSAKAIRQASLPTLARRVRRRLRYTERTIFKQHLEIIRSRPSPVFSLQLPCTGPGETSERAAQVSTSIGSTTQQEGTPSDGRIMSIKRKDSSEETHRRASKKSRTDSSSSSPGPSHRSGRKKSKRQARKEVPLLKKLLKSKLGCDIDSTPECQSSSISESEENLEGVGKRFSSDSDAGPSQDLNPAVVETQSPEKDSEASDCLSEVQDEEQLYEVDNTEFNKKYQIVGDLAEGGYAVVYRGIRKEDNFPVAIKRVSKCLVSWIKMMLNGQWTSVPLEVAMLIRVGAGPGVEDSNVTPVLLDWHNLKTEIVMVLERPDPCMDLVDHINSHEEFMNEHEAKMIFRQLVDAAIKMLDLGIFHRDIKPDNVLIETGQPIPRARFIDFGWATTCNSSQVFNKPQGTDIYTSPEYYRARRYMAGPTTVWQLGLILYCILNKQRAFASVDTLYSLRQPPIRAELTDDCKDFLIRLLDKNPETRMSIDNIKDHPWMN